MADHSKPLVTSTYANFVSELDSRFDDVTLWLDSASTSPTNLPIGAKRWNSTSNKWEKWNGAAWSDLTTGYAINLVGPNTLTAASSSDALRITQTGTGNAFVVEDEANPDSTPFIIKNDGTLLIGTTSVSGSGEKARINGNLRIGFGQDISPASVPNSQLVIDGNGYAGMVGLDSTGMYIGNNSASRSTRIVVNSNTVGTFDLNSNLGLGRAPTVRGIDVYKASGESAVYAVSGGTTVSDYAQFQADAGSYYAQLFQYGSGLAYCQSNGLGFVVGTTSSAPIYFNTANNTRMTISAAGKIGMGVSPSGSYDVETGGTVGIDGNTTIINGYLRTYNGGSASSAASPTIQPGFDADTGMYWPASNTIGFSTAGSAALVLDSNQSATIYGTIGVGASALSNTAIFGTISSVNYSAQFYNQNASPQGLRVAYPSATPNGTSNVFILCSDGSATRMTVRSNGGIANYSANNVNLSDKREKKDFEPSGDYLEKLCQIPVQKFRYINQAKDDDALTIGVIAQDVQSVCPELVMESDWSNGDEGEDPKMRLAIYQTDLEYAMLRAIQELKSELDAVKLELAAIKKA